MSHNIKKVRSADIKIAQPKVKTDNSKTTAEPSVTTPLLANTDSHQVKISLTRIIGSSGSRLTKKFTLEQDGLIRKEGQPNFFNGTAKTVCIDQLSDIQGITQSLSSRECICTGVYNVDSCSVVTKEKYQKSEDTSNIRTRSKDHLHQPEYSLALLDYDPDKYMPPTFKCDSAKVLMDLMVKAMPELEGIGFSAIGSSSNGIYNNDSGAPYEGGGGLHAYIAIKGVDMEQLQQLLKVRLWNAGFGYISFARNGAMLERTIIDLSVLSPERLIYEARPVLGEGVGQKERVWTHKAGEVFTGVDTLPDEEITRYKDLLMEARKNPDNIKFAEQLQNQYRKKQVKRLIEKKNTSPGEAEKMIPTRSKADLASTTQKLDLNESIEMGGKVMLVSELVERGHEFDGKAMPDPVEGSHYGTGTAKYYHNDGINPCIHSFAHGVKTIYKIQGKESNPQIDSRSEVLATVAVPVNLNEPLDAESFPHKKQKKDGTYKPLCTIPSVEYLCKGYGITVQYDVINKETIILIPGVTGITENTANTAIESINSLASLNNMPIGQVARYVAVISDRNPINPVANWITSKPWDGVDRVNTLCDTLTARNGFPDDFKSILIRKWLISAVAAATVPNGFNGRGVLTLQGAQGMGKTTWVRILMPEGLLRDRSILTGHHLDPSNKDSQTTAIKHWIVEIGELDSSFKKDVARLKGFVTLNKDSVRRPYARTDSEYQRRTVFCASVNEENFLIDQTGNSRFWTIPLVKIDYKHDIDMQQVFVQLYDELHGGATWWLTPDEDIQLNELNQAHKSVSAIEERILSILDPDMAPEKWKPKSATEVLQIAGIRSPSNPQARECGGVLRGLYGNPKKYNGIMKWKVPLGQDLVRID